MMKDHAWIEEFKGAVTVCDAEGIIIEMNNEAARLFRKQGGRDLIGSNVMDCHPEPARTKLKKLMDTQQENIYSVEKNGIKRLICQLPWHVDGQYRGFVEIGLTLPPTIPHFIRGN